MTTGPARVALAVSLMALASCATIPQTDRDDQLGFTDLTGAFAEAYERAPPSPEGRLAVLAESFEQELPGFYDPARFGDQAALYQSLAASFFETYPEKRAEIGEVARRFDAMFAPAVEDFERRVGPLPVDTPVYLVVSMGEFDGATRTLGGREYLLFGADMIASIHGGEARAFVQHELFHVYHSGRMGECVGLYCSLWSEGLAVHAASVLNPGASDSELLLTLPEPIRPALDANRTEAICVTLAKLDSREGSDWQAFFSNGRLGEGLPPRFGYLVGAWVAEDLGRTRTLRELADLGGEDLRSAIETSLRSMADCS